MARGSAVLWTLLETSQGDEWEDEVAEAPEEPNPNAPLFAPHWCPPGITGGEHLTHVPNRDTTKVQYWKSLMSEAEQPDTFSTLQAQSSHRSQIFSGYYSSKIQLHLVFRRITIVNE